MEYRKFPRLGWPVSEVGYGMWGIAGGEGGWSGADDESGMESLQRAVDLGCTFFDTAWIYGRGHSEELLGALLKANPGVELVTATKVPPKDRKFPPDKGSPLEAVYPPDHIREYTEKSLKNLGTDSVDLLQLHSWEDEWAQLESWQQSVDDLKNQGLIRGFGISVNRWEPENVLAAIGTGLVDTVQVIYNVFDQSPEDELFPACTEHGVGVIARVPFDEGSLTGTLTSDTTWPEGDWRNSYFVPENLRESVARADALKALVPFEMTLPELALRFILSNPAVSTVIPGMRRTQHVEANMAASSGEALPDGLLTELRKHRWDRTPTAWSQ